MRDVRRAMPRTDLILGEPLVVAAIEATLTAPTPPVAAALATWAAALRAGPEPIVGCLHEDRLLLDVLAIPPEADARLVALVLIT